MKRKDKRKDVIDFEQILGCGKENRTPSKILAQKVDLPNVRSLQCEIARSRDAGQIILSDSSSEGGYYLPDSRESVEEFIAVLKARALNTLHALRSANQYLQQLDGQMSLVDIGEAE